MRMEAKNAYFKDAAKISNFKNVPFSVARRHQRLLCAHLQGSFFTYDCLESGPCKSRLAGSSIQIIFAGRSIMVLSMRYYVYIPAIVDKIVPLALPEQPFALGLKWL